MADDKKSIADILAACRKADGPGGAEEAAPADAPAAESPAKAAPVEKPAKSAAPPSGKKPGEMSVAEMLAAARGEKEKSGGAAPAQPAAASADTPAASAGPKKDPKQMSVAEMLASARGEKAAPKAAAKPAAKPAAAKADAPKPAAKADKPAVAAKSGSSAVQDTSSILAAARAASKPGPMSKAEAAAKGAPVAPVAAGKPKAEVPPMPARPAYAQPRPAAKGKAEVADRRGFIAAAGAALFGSSLAVGFTTLAITHVLWLLGLARFMFPNILIEPPTRFKVGFPDDFAPGQVQEKFKAQFGVWIVRYEFEGQAMLFALKTVCTHLGCTPNWLESEQKFKCPCHGSGFYKDGVNFEGPAPRPLERYAIRLSDDGQLEVDKSRTFQEELGQWQDPASFHPV